MLPRIFPAVGEHPRPDSSILCSGLLKEEEKDLRLKLKKRQGVN
jgi:hypothetical protein